jgi:hypothetical protein
LVFKIIIFGVISRRGLNSITVQYNILRKSLYVLDDGGPVWQKRVVSLHESMD